MKRAIAVGVLSSFAALAFIPKAHAESFFTAEVGLGGSLYQGEDGRWQEQGVAYNNLHNKNIAFSAGLTGPLYRGGRWGVDWHADYVNLGRVAADCNCVTDENLYDSKAHKLIIPMSQADTAYFTGNGRSQGAVLSLEPYYWWKGLRWGIEAGAYIHHDKWDQYVYGFHGNDLGNIGSSFWAVSPVAGASVSTGHWTLAYRHYFTHRSSMNAQAKGIAPPLWNDINTLEVRYKF